ncbi:MAG: hypothetical protein AABX83_01640 [Nanoarchaeota archaeon]
MAKEEILQRLWYVDYLYDKAQFRDKNLKEVKVIIDAIKKEVNALSLKGIKERVGNNNLFFNRLEGKYCKLIELELNKSCVCDIHQLQFRTPYTPAPRGELFVNIVNNLNTETAERVNSMGQIIGILIAEMPPIVRKYGKKFEVLMGNHRTISLIRNGEKTCKVLCLCEENEVQDFPNLLFPT